MIVPCPLLPCAANLQPNRAGSLAAGLEAHLTVVHGLAGPDAAKIAEVTLRRRP